MKNKNVSVLVRTNALLIGYLILLWWSASYSVQFSVVKVLEDSFPGDRKYWIDNGVSENIEVQSQSVSIVPTVKKRAQLAKQYMLEAANTNNRYISVRSRVISKLLNESPLENDEELNSEESLLFSWFVDENEKRVGVVLLEDLKESDQEIQTSRVFAVSESAIFVNVGFLLRKFQATHTLVALEVSQIERTKIYYMTLTALVVIPFIFFCFTYTRILKKISALPVSFVVVILVAMVLVVGVLLPGNILREVLGEFRGVLPALQNILQGYQASTIQGLLHVVGFTVLTLVVLSMCTFIRYNKKDAIFKVLLFAIFTEVIQRHSVERMPSLFDVFIDSVGVLLGILVWCSVNLVLSRWRQRSELA